MMDKLADKLCMTIEEMGRQLGIGKSKAYELSRRKGFYPAIRITERRIIINVEALKKWLDEQGEKK
jgi:excisionase family DNA binding protein